MNELYPLKFNPIFKDKIWGGNKIKSILGKDYGDLPNCGETWELSGVEGNISTITNGPLTGKSLQSIITENGKYLLGSSVQNECGGEFPLLIKFIDANQDLSIQVHPNDELAKERHDCKGKTEMWYVVQADEGSTLISGFNQEVNKEKYLEYFESGRLTEILNNEEVQGGDLFYLPAGRVHTIGKGLLIAEIQQTSDITYRIYDFDRVDAEGNKRELHVEQALDAIDYNTYDDHKTKYQDKKNDRVSLVSCQYFQTNKLWLDKGIDVDFSDLDSFKAYVCVGGSGRIIDGIGQTTEISIGEVVLVPAIIKKYQIETDSEVTLLETYIG